MPAAKKPRLVLTASDAAKLERIWNDHATIVLGMLKAFCASPEDAQDALQELFLRVGKNIAVVESAKSPRAFLIVAARRIAIDTARKRAADQRRHESPEASEAVHPSPEPARNDPETAAAISAAVRELPPEQRAVFEAKILQGKTLAVIAAEQAITLNTAASRLRYSLDKIRARLRPHYTTMKNQTNKPNTLSDSPERLIKPLEPKRVPSVVPGLEGAAALAVEDIQPDAEPEVVACELPPPSFENFEEPILIVCEPFTETPTIDLPAEEQEPIDLSEQPVDEILSEIFEGGEEVAVIDGSWEIDLGEFYNQLLSEYDSFLAENPDWITENSGGEMHAQVVTPSDYTGLELPDPGAARAFDLWYYKSYIAPYELEITDGGSDATGEDVTTIDDSWEFDLGEFYNQLLREYDSFLVENPNWITENSGGEMHAQVVTPSYYTGLELADPGAARAFDLWFENTYLYCNYPEDSGSGWDDGSGVEFETQPLDPEEFNNDLLSEYKAFLESNPDWVASHTGEIQLQVLTSSEYARIEFGNPGEAAAFDQWFHDTYIAPYDRYQLDAPEVLPVKGGSLNVGGGSYDYGTLLTTDRSGGVPQEWWRGGVQLSGGGTIAVNDGVGILNPGNLSLNQVPTPVLGGTGQTVVTGGTLVSNQPLEGNFTVQKGGTITAGDQTFGEGTYQFSAEETVASRETNATEAPAAAEVVAAASTNQGSATNGIQVPTGIDSSVTPIISGSDSVAESPESLTPASQPAFDPAELPKLVEAQSASASEEPSVSDDIAFTDDDSFVPASTEPQATASAATPAPAKDDVTAAVGGAFVAGTAAQAAPAKAASIRKAIPLKG